MGGTVTTRGPLRVNEAGARLGRYVLLVRIGAGGMGEVWLGELAGEHAFKRYVAVKAILDEHAADAAFREMFLREARVAARLFHANVVEVLDLAAQDGRLYQVMEYVDGESLARLLALARAARGSDEPAVSPGVVARVVADALRGLHAAHEMADDEGRPLRFVHRDVSPHNVLVGADGVARIADFGIAKTAGDPSSQTHAGSVKGKPGYMSPEQAAGGALDRRSDVFSMGIVAWEALTGRRLAAPGELAPTLRASRHADERLAVHAPLAAAIERALEPDPGARFRSAEEMADAIEASGACATSRDVATWVSGIAGEHLEARRRDAREASRRLRGQSSTVAARRGPSSPAPPGSPAPGARESATPTRSLAVLPFRYRGPSDKAYLADAFGEELVDVLSRSSGLRVLSSGAVARFRDERDPSAVRGALGADVVVDATMQVGDALLRIGVRLVDTASGVQLWSEPFLASIEDSFAVQETMSKRIAEALRVELLVRTATAHGNVDAEAVELCLRARGKLRAFRLFGGDGALALLKRALEIAPHSQPPLASLAIATVRAWFVPMPAGERVDEADARAAVDRALQAAGALPESQFAAAILALHTGDLAGAMSRLGRTLSLAPHLAEALALRGSLECESGLLERGVEHLELALALSPDLSAAYGLAYHHALHGRFEDFEAVLTRSKDLHDATALVVLEMRVAFWRGDTARVNAASDRLLLTESARGRFEPYALALRGQLTLDELEAYFERVTAPLTNGRMRALFYQLATEVYALRGDVARAEAYLDRASRELLVDLDWLDACRALGPLRSGAAFATVRERVAERARAMRDD